MTSNNNFDAVVIGAGVIGAATAYELARRGRSVLCVDKLPAAGFGSTSNSCAIVRFTYSTQSGVAMAYEGLYYWKNWADYLETSDETGLIEYRQCGQLFLHDGSGHVERVLPHFDALGIPYEMWSVEEFHNKVPYAESGLFGPPSRPSDDGFWDDPKGQLLGVLYVPESGYVSDPQLSAHNLQRAGEAKGAEFRFGTEVTEIKTADAQITGVSFADGTKVSTPVVVNVAGPHSYLINQMAGAYDEMNIKTKALRHEVHHTPAPADVDFEAAGFCMSDDDGGYYIRPEVGNHILIGSGDPACDPQVWVHPDDYDTEVAHDQWEAQLLRLNRRFPKVGMPREKKGIVDLYDVSDDWIPIYDHTAVDGFYVAIGTSGNQFKNAGVAGHCMAELIDAIESGHDHDADPLVVKGRYSGLEIDLGTFSRNREINANSSMTVHG